MTELSGVVLAGGYSRRFGDEDKALAAVDGQPMVVRVVERLAAAVDDVLVSCRPAQTDRLKDVLSGTRVTGVVEDGHPGAGPLAGIEAGLDAVRGRYTAVVACDMPFVDPDAVRTLFRRVSVADADAAVPVEDTGTLQPVQAVYRTEPMHDIAVNRVPEEGSVMAAVAALSVVTVEADTLPGDGLDNVNTRDDLAAARRRHDHVRSTDG